jgi:ChrR-like protein with cupin domain
MGQRNWLETHAKGFQQPGSLAIADSSETPSGLGVIRLQPDTSVLYREALFNQ